MTKQCIEPEDIKTTSLDPYAASNQFNKKSKFNIISTQPQTCSIKTSNQSAKCQTGVTQHNDISLKVIKVAIIML